MHAEHDGASLIESTGPWPFVTRMTFLLPGRRRVVWQSRVHRKRLGRGGPISLSLFTSAVIRCLWRPPYLRAGGPEQQRVASVIARSAYGTQKGLYGT
jgi:hypothetical protein